MRNIALAFVLGLLLAGHRNSLGSGEPERADREDGVPELRFVIELGERANDRLLNDIRAFNAVAYALLVPLLAITSFIDYHDAFNISPLALSALAIVFAYQTVRSGDGLPTPNPADETLFELFARDSELGRRNVLEDLGRWGPINSRIREAKRRAVVWAGRFVLLAIVASMLVKGVESEQLMRRTDSPTASSPKRDSADDRARKPTASNWHVDPSERHSFAYDLTTNRPVTDDDVEKYLERLARPWWKFW